ncbi:hypothetical protein [Paracidovorax avenae]|uniref:hypothetical protein n=1 Tax=Paracidovorax avenae TaxID=80867 RepID=UPI001AD8210D|nr:hypothetical protein [Paracidovorax avenae]
MRKLAVFTALALASAVATARPDYQFKVDWNASGNNDQNYPGTDRPYTESQIKAFLDSKKDKRSTQLGGQLLAACGVVQVQKGCHQANDRHVTIYVDPRDSKNKVKACTAINTGSGVHVDGC